MKFHNWLHAIKRWPTLQQPKTNQVSFHDNHKPIKTGQHNDVKKHKTIKENLGDLPSTLILDLGPGSDFFKDNQNEKKIPQHSAYDPNSNWPPLDVHQKR